MNLRIWCMCCFLGITPFLGNAQTVPQIQVSAGVCYDDSRALPLSDFISIDGDGNEMLEGIIISITENFKSTDELNYTSVTGIAGSYDAINGVLTLTGNATIDRYREALQNTSYLNASANPGYLVKEITASLSAADYFDENGHFYKFFPQAGISWEDANTAAGQQELFGLTGYLATITTKEENDFILLRVTGTSWIGATDNNQEGTWRWVTGPEGLENAGIGRLMNDGFTNWNNFEPNDCCSGATGEENYAHMMDWSSPPGRWNDLSDQGAGGQYAPTGYIVEYGGMPGDPAIQNLAGSARIERQPEVDIAGSVSVCPNVTNVVYSVDSIPGYSYIWTIDGGAPSPDSPPQNSASVWVNWGDTNSNAKVEVLPVSPEMICMEPFSLDVRINEQLEPPAPEGPLVICRDEISEQHVYSTPNTSGSTYEWTITNGNVVAGDGTNEVRVVWDQNTALGTLSFTERTTTSTNVCDGDSPTIEIVLREALAPVLETTDVSCHSGSDGSVEVVSLNGPDPVSYVWNTNGEGVIDDNQVTMLPAGSYSVDVTSDGCTANVPFIIEQPFELEGTVEATDVLCYGTATGTATASIEGGTPPYALTWSNGGTDQPFQDGFAKDLNHYVDVVDANNCSIRLFFPIEEPEELVLDSIRSTFVNCPNGTDGTLEAFVSGGTAPYTFEWETNDANTALATGFSKGTYSVTVTDGNGCVVSGSQFVQEAVPKVYIPNAFSPNGDDDNDYFKPATGCNFEFRMIIYNRWGSIVFATNDINPGWDGMIDNQPAPDGVYTYQASWTIEANNRLISSEKRGTLRLFR